MPPAVKKSGSAILDENYHWYAVYTKSRHEKKLMDLLLEKDIEAYVPIRKTLRQWSDRKKYVEEPIIRSYCFVKVNNANYFEVLNTTGAVRYVWFSGKPASIPDQQIKLLKAITGSDLEVDCMPDTFKPGTRVIVNSGPLIGIKGELVSILRKQKVIIRIEQLKQVLTLSISPVQLDLA